MARRPEHEMNDIKFQWEQRMHSPEFNEMSQAKQALEMKVSIATVYRWHNEASPAFWKNVTDTIRNQYSRHMVEVDMALKKAALGGNITAIELMYKRHEGWSPKTTSENINRNGDFEGMSLEEKKAEALKLYTPEELAKALAEKKAPGVVVEPDAVENNG